MTTEGEIQSPAIGLAHELGHAYDFNMMGNDGYYKWKHAVPWESDGHFDNRSEEHATKKYENPTAKALGEPRRWNSEAILIITLGPTSRLPRPDFTVPEPPTSDFPRTPDLP